MKWGDKGKLKQLVLHKSELERRKEADRVKFITRFLIYNPIEEVTKFNHPFLLYNS